MGRGTSNWTPVSGTRLSTLSPGSARLTLWVSTAVDSFSRACSCVGLWPGGAAVVLGDLQSVKQKGHRVRMRGMGTPSLQNQNPGFAVHLFDPCGNYAGILYMETEALEEGVGEPAVAFAVGSGLLFAPQLHQVTSFTY